MSSISRSVAGILLLVLLAAGCGGNKKGADGKPGANNAVAGGEKGAAARASPAPPPSGLTDLLPENTVGVAYIPSLEALEGAIKRIAAAVGEKEVPPLLDLALSEMQLQRGDIDTSRPAAIAMTLEPGGEMPKMVVILPAKDEKALAEKLQAGTPQMQTDAGGGFVAASPMGPFKRGGMPAALKGGFVAGEASIRLDVATLAKSFAPMLFQEAESGLEMLGQMGGSGAAPGTNPTAILRPMLDGLKSVVDAASLLDLALRVDGTRVEYEIALGFKEGAKVPLLDVFSKADLAALARRVPGDDQITMAAAINAENLWKLLGGFLTASLDVYPAEQRPAMQSMFDKASGMMKLMGNGLVASGGISDSGMQLAYAIEAPDPEANIRKMREIAGGMDFKDSFLSVSPLEERTVDGTKVHTIRFKVDAAKMPKAPGAGLDSGAMVEKLYGKDGLAVNVAAFDKRMAVVMGSDEFLARALKAAKADAPNPLSNALQAAGSDTTGLLQIEIRSFARAIIAFMKDSPAGKRMPPVEVPSGGPLMLTVIANAGPRQLRGRVVADVGEIAKMIRAMMK